MGKFFWPIYIAVASVSCALVWRFAPALGERLPPEVRGRICAAVDSATAWFSRSDATDEGNAGVEDDFIYLEASDTNAVALLPRAPVSAPAPTVRDNDPSPKRRGVFPVDATHANWGVVNRITHVEELNGKPIGTVPGGSFFKVKKAVPTPDGLKVTGTFVSKKLTRPVRILAENLSCFSGQPSFLSTNQQTCLRMYYQLTGEAEARKEKVQNTAAGKSPYLRDAAAALRQLRAREKAAMTMKAADVDTLRKVTYEISQLRDKVNDLNQKHKDWKAEHAAELPDPEKDPAYLEILRQRQSYVDPIRELLF